MDTSPGDLVSLGSSFASGPGLLPYADAACLRSTANYPSRVAQALSLSLTDVSCGGATTANILSTPQLTRTGARPPQLAALGPATRLVTVTAGGNDVDYLVSLYRYSCQNSGLEGTFRTLLAGFGLSGPALDGYVATLCGPVDEAAVQAKLDGLQSQLTSTLTAVRTAAPAARVVVVDYETVLPEGRQTCSALPLTADQVLVLNGVARDLQLATKHAARAAGAELVELSKASRGHDACSAEPWVTPYSVAGVLGGAAYHPNAASMAAAAELVVRQLS